MDFVTGLTSATTAPAVRVQRNGNSKVLPLPAGLARQIQADFGEVYSVEIAGDDVIYHRRDTHRVSIHGAGDSRFGVISEDDVMAAPQRASVPPLDWNF